MTDDLTKTGKQDRIRINIHQDHEVQYWTGKLGCTREDLEEAVKLVGPIAEDVRVFLCSDAAGEATFNDKED